VHPGKRGQSGQTNDNPAYLHHHFPIDSPSGYAGLHMQKRLADERKTDQSRGVVGQVAGLVSLLLALVLGTLIGVSFAYFSTQETELEGFSAQILRLDQALAQWAGDQARAGQA
jgi:hypothetical protein